MVLVQPTHEHRLSDGLRLAGEDFRKLVQQDGVLMHDLVVALLLEARAFGIARLWSAWISVVYHWFHLAMWAAGTCACSSQAQGQACSWQGGRCSFPWFE